MLDTLDELGIADNTIVIYSTDNGAEKVTWPDGGNVDETFVSFMLDDCTNVR